MLSYDQWYVDGGRFVAGRVLELWRSKVAQVRSRGFDGLRVTGNTSWLDPSQWSDFMSYEGLLYGSVGALPIVAVCSYGLDRCGAGGLLELHDSHQTVMVRRSGSWEVKVSGRYKSAEWKALFDGVSEALFVVDQNGLIVGANDRGADLAGEPIPVGGGMSAHDLIRRLHLEPLDQTHEASTALEAMFVDGSRNGQIWRGSREGREVFLRLRPRPINDETGCIRYLLLASDVTELMQSQRSAAIAAQAEREARLQADARASDFRELLKAVELERDMWRCVFNAMPVGVAVFDETGAVLESNQAIHDISGLAAPPGSVPVVPGLQYPDGGAMAYNDLPERAILRGEGIKGFAALVDTPARGPVDVLVSGGALGVQRPQKYYEVHLDITEMRKLERMKDEFLLVVSHELRNPLQIIGGLLQLLQLKLAPAARERVSGNLATLSNQIYLLTSIVEDILTAYRIGSGRLTVHPSEVELNAIVRQAVASYSASATHRVTHLQDGVQPVLARADRQRVVQILHNLLSNAVKYTPDGKHIWVTVERRNGDALVKVEDEGIGIPPEQLERVFEGFHRAHEFSEWKSGGVGLGLYISRHLARKHGGDLWAQNRPGGGTAMVLRIPLAAKSAPATGAAASCCSSKGRAADALPGHEVP